MTVKTITAFDVEAIETGDPNARPCTICHNVRLSHGLDASKTIKSRWAVTNHDDSGGPRYACDVHLVKTMREWE